MEEFHFQREKFALTVLIAEKLKLSSLAIKVRLIHLLLFEGVLERRRPPMRLDTLLPLRMFDYIAPLTECNFDDLKIGIDMELVFEEEPGDEGNLAVVYKYRPMRSSRIQ